METIFYAFVASVVVAFIGMLVDLIRGGKT